MSVAAAPSTEGGAPDDVVQGAESVPVKTAEIIQVDGTKMTPRRAMYSATMNTAAGSGKPVNDVPADAVEEGAADGATGDVVLCVETTECCHGKNWTEVCHKQLVTMFGTWYTGVDMSD